MKKLLFGKLTILFLFVLLINSCNKEGQGGTAVIQGQLIGVDFDKGDKEVTEVIFPNGMNLEHGNYWVLNTPDVNDLYYIWYDNPNWISNGDPALSGRVGIKVSFNYSDSNLDLASRTANSILATTSSFDIEVFNDILKIRCTSLGDCPDANEMTTPFEVNIDQQGSDNYYSDDHTMIDEDVYIYYGNNEIYDDAVQTDINGFFRFTNLTKGDYTLSFKSLDTTTDQTIEYTQQVSIAKRNEVKDLGEIMIMY